jgi:hypothetical protein
MSEFTLRTTPSPPTPGPPLSAARRLRKRLKRLAWAGVGFLGILLVIFLLLPVWMSNEQGRLYVLERLNRGSLAHISADDWSLSWFKGTRLKNLSITLPDNTRLLFCPRVKTELTLWGILFGNYDLGTTNIDTLQVNLTKYADGTTSLDALAPAAGGAQAAPASSRLLERLRSIRGSLQIQSAVVTINSAVAAESITYTDVKAALTIAAAEAPFHIAITALGPDRTLSLNATLPAPADWPPSPWALLSDMDVSATNLPTGLTCDWLRLDPRWRQSIGPSIAALSLMRHPATTDASEASLRIAGSADHTSITAHGLLRLAPGAAGDALFTAGNEASGDGLVASLMPSPPLVALIAQANPILASLKSSNAPLNITASDIAWDSRQPQMPSADVRITWPTLTLERAGIFGQLLNFGGIPQPSANTPDLVAAEASPLHLELAHGERHFTNFSLVLLPPAPKYRLTFEGQVSPDNHLHLLAHLPLAPGGSLESGVADVPITGTTAHPTLTLPH